MGETPAHGGFSHAARGRTTGCDVEGFFVMSMFRRWLTNDEGVTLIEYSLLVAILSVTLISILFTVGADIADVFQRVSTDFAG
ncbi:MAG: hypothetical protein CML99_00030 [Rhodobiaceae bacterium]|nr:hypothetical protein [Rhodobiaceae bacterium]